MLPRTHTLNNDISSDLQDPHPILARDGWTTFVLFYLIILFGVERFWKFYFVFCDEKLGREKEKEWMRERKIVSSEWISECVLFKRKRLFSFFN